MIAAATAAPEPSKEMSVSWAAPPKMIQERLGHSSMQMTMDVYGHLFPDTDDGEALAEAERQLISIN